MEQRESIMQSSISRPLRSPRRSMVGLFFFPLSAPPPSRPEGKGAVQARWTRCFGLFLLLLIVNGRRSQRPKSSVHGERAATFFSPADPIAIKALRS